MKETLGLLIVAGILLAIWLADACCDEDGGGMQTTDWILVGLIALMLIFGGRWW